MSNKHKKLQQQNCKPKSDFWVEHTRGREVSDRFGEGGKPLSRKAS